jgi:hydroxyacylglutathione hydrolase
VRVLPTHGFGSFCSAYQAEGSSTTIDAERTSNDALVRDVGAFVADLLTGLDDIPAYYAHMGPTNAAGPAPVDLTPQRADAAQITTGWPPANGSWTCVTASPSRRATSPVR